MTARGKVDQSEAVVALRDLLAATERHVFGDECLEERDAARRALTAPPSRGAPGPTAMFHLAVATLERGAAIDQLTDDEIAVIVSAVLAGIENNRAHTDAQRVAELEAALRDYGSHDNGCTFYDSMQDHCSCGYSKALARARHPIT
jgi:hypothetical protein